MVNQKFIQSVYGKNDKLFCPVGRQRGKEKSQNMEISENSLPRVWFSWSFSTAISKERGEENSMLAAVAPWNFEIK